MLAQSSAKKVPRNLKKQLEALDDEYDKQRFKLADQLERMDSEETLLIQAEEHEESEEEENQGLDDPDLYFGEVAKDKFWDFYKSDRKFKDFNLTKQEIADPRQAYF